MICDETNLLTLLEADEDDVTIQEIADHVDQCDVCRQRLDDFSRDEFSRDERDVRNLLADVSDEYLSQTTSIVIALDSSLPESLTAECTELALEFLEPPSHPEMLGRLGRYEIERLIGNGGMGIVLKGFDTELHRPVAIKLLAPHLAHSGAARQRFAREGQAAAAVVHEHVLPIHNVESHNSVPYLVMPFVHGRSLQARVDDDGPLPVSEALRIGRQMAAGLAAAHDQGLVHRDVKPGNVLLEDNVDRALIGDFGLARAVDDASLTRTGIVAGTPHYMSPEQADGGAVDHRSDLFSLGSVFYFMVTGHPPFRADGAMGVLNRICHETHRPADEVNSSLPIPLVDLIERLLQKSPDRRLQTARDVEHELAKLLVESTQPTRWRTRRQEKRRRATGWAIGATPIILGLVLAVPFLMPDTDRTESDRNKTPVQGEPRQAKQDGDASDNPLVTTEDSSDDFGKLPSALIEFLSDDFHERATELELDIQETEFEHRSESANGEHD